MRFLQLQKIAARRFPSCLALGLLLGAAAPYRIEMMEEPPKLSRRGSQKLEKGKVLILQQGQPERWEALVHYGPSGREVVKKVRRLRHGRPWRLMVGNSPRSSAVRLPQVCLAYGLLKLEATAYDPGPEANEPANLALTFTGDRARFGIAAVDPQLIPLRTLLYVEGYGPARALDIGGAIKGRRIDLCFNSTREADAWGRRRTRVWLLSQAPASLSRQALAVLRQNAK